jgi:hypothetical protein
VSTFNAALALGDAAPPGPDPCTLPTTPAATPEQTAWQILVAASCPTGKTASPLAWETWTEQSCFANPPPAGCGLSAAAAGGAMRHLHGSRLALRRKQVKFAAQVPGGCSPMVTKSGAGPLAPFVPANLSTNPTFCEEVFVNSSEAMFVRAPATGQSLETLKQQNGYVQSGATIQFPTTAVEIKADWLPASSLSPGSFDCTTPPAGLHVETIGGNCYALVGIHVSSKLLSNWLWATFEPQSTVTNPNRCNPKLYSNCNDPWGSNPASSTGTATQQTAALTALMTQAKLAPELANYHLVAAQTAFTDLTTNAPTLMGNSFIEFNAGVTPLQASCITCHGSAVFAPSKSGSPQQGGVIEAVGTPVLPKPPSGASWTTQDFSWMLGVGF